MAVIETTTRLSMADAEADPRELMTGAAFEELAGDVAQRLIAAVAAVPLA